MEEISGIQRKVAEYWMRNVIGHWKRTLIILIVLIAIAAVGLGSLEVDDSYDSALVDDDPLALVQNEFEDVFGDNQMNFILVESEYGVFSYETLSFLEEAGNSLESNVPFVDEVTTLANMEEMTADGDSLVISPLIEDEIPDTEEELRNIEERVMRENNRMADLVTDDQTGTGIILTVQDNIPDTVYIEADSDFNHLEQGDTINEVITSDQIHLEPGDGLVEMTEPIMLVAPAIDAVMNDLMVNDFEYTSTGMTITLFEREVIITEEITNLGILAVIASGILMLILFKSLRPVLSSMMVMYLTLIVLFGIKGWVGVPVAFQTMIIMLLALVLSVGYSIHFINHFKYKFKLSGDRAQSIYYAYLESNWPIFITAFTTAAGFISFVAVPNQTIRIVGIFSALAAFLAYLLVMTVVPLIFYPGKNKEPVTEEENVNQRFNKAMTGLSHIVTEKLKPIVFVTVLIIVLLVVGLFRFETTSDIHAMFGDELDFIQDAHYVADRLGYMYSYDVFIELPEEEMGRTSEILQGVAALQDEIEGYTGTVTTGSITNLIKEMNMIMNGNDPDYFAVPDDDQLISQYLLLYEMGGGEGLEDFVDFSYENIRISVQVSGTDDEIMAYMTGIEERADEYLPADVKTSAVGELALANRTIDLLGRGQINSIAVALIGITLIMILILKSVKLGLMAMIPNALPVLAILGIMGLFGYRLDATTIMISPMILGIAVDDTVHFFIHFKEEYARYGDYQKATEITLQKIGKALISTSVVLMLGFLILSRVRVDAFTNMGILSALGIFVALAADMIIAPALLKYFKPFSKERN